MITATEISNRAVSVRDAARLSGLAAGSLAKLRHNGDVTADKTTLGRVLSLRVAEHLRCNGIELRSAAQIAEAVTDEEWENVVRMAAHEEYFLAAFRGRDGVWMVEVVQADELRSFAVYAPIVVSLTQTWLNTDKEGHAT